MLTASAQMDPRLPQGREHHLSATGVLMAKPSVHDLPQQQPSLKKQPTQGMMRRRHSISTTGFLAATASVGVLDANSCSTKPRTHAMKTGGKVLETRASSSSSLLMLSSVPTASPVFDRPRHSIASMATSRHDSATLMASDQTTITDMVASHSTSSSSTVGVLIKQRHHHQRHVQIHHSTSSAPRRELPILRCQYVARNVQVLVGTRWKLRKFETRHIVLHVNGTTVTSPLPTLTIWDSASKDLRDAGDTATDSDTRTTFTLPLTLQCTHNDSRHELKLKSTGDSNDTGNSGFRIKVRFATAADARIWFQVLQATMTHARWVHSLDEDTSWLSSDARVVVAHHGPTNEHFVIKVLPRARVDDGGKRTELLVLKKLYAAIANAGTTATNSSGLAYLLAYRVVETKKDVRIVMPKFPGTNLLQFLQQQQSNRRHKLSEVDAQILIKNLCRSLAALHALGIVHCDLKLENILLTDVSNARIIDFGGAFDLAWITDNLAKFQPRHRHHRMVGTPGYIAPERIQNVDTPPSPAADVFSLGIILFQLLTGRQPFARHRHGYRGAGGSNSSRHPLRLQDTMRLHWASAEHILKSHGVSSEATDLVQRMVDPDPHTRIPVSEILRHAWFC
ncbi:Serine/threonine protein kinase, partial [Globisporangium splendens]